MAAHPSPYQPHPVQCVLIHVSLCVRKHAQKSSHIRTHTNTCSSPYIDQVRLRGFRVWEGGRVGCYIVFSAAQLENAFSCRVGSIFYNKTRSPFVVARPQGRERESERKRENVICSNTTNRTCVEIERFAVFEVEDVCARVCVCVFVPFPPPLQERG